ncbi:lipopolysaccharide heptosyltransferase II [Candidatus Omnitrophota bacterium]
MKEIDKDSIHKILVIRTDRMGDVLLNIPAIRALKQSFSASIVALVNPDLKELLSGSPEIDQILSFRQEGWNKSPLSRLRLLWQIRKMKFDLAVILNPAKRFHILTYLAGIPRRLGYDRKWGFLLTHKIKDSKSLGQRHEVEYNLDLARSIGADTQDKSISLKVEQQDREWVEGLLSKQGVVNGEEIVALHPHSSNPAKCWPRENFVILCDQLQEQGLKVAIIGGVEQRKAARKLAALAKYPPINLSGKLSLKQLVAFFQRSSLLVSNDSGPVHVAAAAGAPTVVIFGRNLPGVSPRRWGPWGSGHIILHKDPGCNPCLDRDCPYNFKCLTAITPQEVLQAVKTWLEK